MSIAKELARCPECQEPIHPKATRCKHCLKDIVLKKKKAGLAKQNDNFRVGFLAGVLFSIVMALLLYMQLNP